MTRWVPRLYPFLIALVPVLNYAARNPAQFRFQGLALMIGAALVGCGLVYALAALLTRGRAPAALPPFVALLATVAFFSYPQLGVRVSATPGDPPHALLVPITLAVFAAVVWWVWRREALLEGMGKFFTLMGALLVGWSTVQVGIAWMEGRRTIARSELAGELARPIEGPAAAPEPRRDIYVIVLDEYANSAVLRERFEYDNRPFEDSLRALGFHVPRLVRSNYLHTLLSVPSMLNSAHLDRLQQELGASKHPALPNYLVEHNRVARYLEKRGYHHVFFPSQWWQSTSGSSVADTEFRPWSGFNFMRSMAAGELERTVRGASILRYFDRTHRWEADHVRRTLRGLAALPRDSDPTFAFAHILKPHDPFVFDSECAILRRGRETDKVGPYLEQLECVNHLLLATVRQILRTSDVPPIIILQGDHGSKLLGATGYSHVDKVPPAAARERLGAFGAYFLPGGGAAAFGDTVTVVNVLGDVLRHYFGADLPRAGDEHYLSTVERPYEFRRVDAPWLAGVDSGGLNLRAGR